jgi:hypothetical protein
MDIAKIKELIDELQQDIKIKEEAVSSLEKLLAGNNGRKVAAPVVTPVTASDNLVIRGGIHLFGANDSYVDLAVKLIEANGRRPLSVSAIVDQIRVLKNNPNIERRSVEATLHQHTTKAASPRLVKMAPGMYGLRKSGEETAA